MGSGDLNLLKSWNPKLLKNRQRVWEREQEVKREEEKFTQRQKEIKKERELNELINSTRDPNLKKDLLKKSKHGLEWMYNDHDNLPEENEDYLLGKRKLDSTIIKVKDNQNLYSSSINNNNDTKNPFLTSSIGTGVSLKSGISSNRKFDYSNDDPMAKLLAKPRMGSPTLKRVTKKKIQTINKANRNSISRQITHHTTSKRDNSIDY